MLKPSSHGNNSQRAGPSGHTLRGCKLRSSRVMTFSVARRASAKPCPESCPQAAKLNAPASRPSVRSRPGPLPKKVNDWSFCARHSLKHQCHTAHHCSARTSPSRTPYIAMLNEVAVFCEGCLAVGCDHGPQAEVAQGVGPGPLVER